VSAEPRRLDRPWVLDATVRRAVNLRPAGPADRQQIWLWRNEPETRAASFNSATIPWDAHERWFDSALLRDDRRIFIIEADAVAVGTARLDIVEREASVSIHLAREWQGQGVGSSALSRLAELAFNDFGIDRLIASTKSDNRASLAAFAKAGFKAVEPGRIVRLERWRSS